MVERSQKAVLDTWALIELVSGQFPDLRPNLEEYLGLETLQAMTLMIRTQNALDLGDLETVRRCFALADRLLQHGDRKVQNAIHVSYLETLDFRRHNGSAAFAELTPRLLAGWKGVNEYMEKLLDGNWVWKGPLPA